MVFHSENCNSSIVDFHTENCNPCIEDDMELKDFYISEYAFTILGKTFGTKWSNPVKLDKKRKVWYLFLRVF